MGVFVTIGGKPGHHSIKVKEVYPPVVIVVAAAAAAAVV